MQRRVYWLLATLMILSLLVAACGSSTPDTESEQPAQVAQPEQPAGGQEAAQPTGGEEAAQAGDPMRRYAGETIVVSWPSLSHFQVAAQLIPQFEEETGITVWPGPSSGRTNTSARDSCSRSPSSSAIPPW